MSFMELHITPKGALYTAECGKCGATLFVHEWAAWDNNGERDAMQAGTLACTECGLGRANPATFSQVKGKHYAARYSADGYLDCTEWNYGTNKRRLIREMRSLYGDES